MGRAGRIRVSRWALLLGVCMSVCRGAFGVEPQVPGFNELLVVDPGVQENGLPAPIVNSAGQVEIPPTLHIHAYYYSGDKEYQGPILNGGPTIVVATHPWSGEKKYIDVILPQGAPVIAYNKHSITYVYPDQRVSIEFLPVLENCIRVRHISGRGIDREVRDSLDKASAKIETHHRRSKLSHEVHELAKDTGNVVKGAVGVVGHTAAFGVQRIRLATHYVPGFQTLRSLGEQSEERQGMEEIRQAGIEMREQETEFIRTVR